MNTPRTILLQTTDTEAADELRNLLSVVENPPLIPLPPGANWRTTKQERWTSEQVDAYIVTIVHRLSGRVQFVASLIMPDLPS